MEISTIFIWIFFHISGIFVSVEPQSQSTFLFLYIIMSAVHSRGVHLVRVSGKSCPRQDWASATLHTLAESSQFWHATQGDSQARHETLWLVHHRPLKKWYLNEARHERWGYTRGSKARQLFPSTFSLSPCLGFPRWESTAGIIFRTCQSFEYHISTLGWGRWDRNVRPLSFCGKFNSKQLLL